MLGADGHPQLIRVNGSTVAVVSEVGGFPIRLTWVNVVARRDLVFRQYLALFRRSTWPDGAPPVPRGRAFQGFEYLS